VNLKAFRFDFIANSQFVIHRILAAQINSPGAGAGAGEKH